MYREAVEKKPLLHPYGPTFGPVRAILWELWELSRWELLIRILGPGIFWSCIFWLLKDKNNGMDAQFLAIPVFMLSVTTSLFSSLWMNDFDNTQSGFNFYLGFSRPISTVKLVAIPMVYISCAAALCYLVPMGILRMVFNIPFPLLPIAASLAAANALFIMAVWSPQSRYAKAVNFMVMGPVTVTLLIFRIKGRADFSNEMFTPDMLEKLSLSSLDYLVLLILFTGSIVVTTVCVGRQRHGERISGVWPSVERTDLSNHLLRWNGPFSTSRQAQYWYEMRRSGVPLLLCGLGATVFVFLGMLALGGVDDSVRIATAFWILALLLCPFAFLLIGTEWLLGLRHHQGTVSMPLFDATQAMDNRGLMVIKLLVLFSCVFLSWLFLAGSAATWTMLWGDYHLWTKAASTIQPFLARVSLPYWGCIGFILFVSCLSATAMLISVALFGQRYPKIILTFFCMGIIYFVLYASNIKHHWLPPFIWEAHAWILACAYCSATLVLWRKALREGFLQQRHFFVSLCLWSAYVGAAVALYLHVIPSDVTVPFSGLILGLSSLLLPLLTIAATPLALAIHRHQ